MSLCFNLLGALRKRPVIRGHDWITILGREVECNRLGLERSHCNRLLAKLIFVAIYDVIKYSEAMEPSGYSLSQEVCFGCRGPPLLDLVPRIMQGLLYMYVPCRHNRGGQTELSEGEDVFQDLFLGSWLHMTQRARRSNIAGVGPLTW